MTAIIKASLDTHSFSFEAYGASQESAESALRGALARHGAAYRLPKNWAAEYLPGIEFRNIQIGQAYRNREPI